MSSPKKPPRPRAKKPSAKPQTSTLPRPPSRAPRSAKPSVRRLDSPAAPPAEPAAPSAKPPARSATKPAARPATKPRVAKPRRPRPKAQSPAAPASPKPPEQASPNHATPVTEPPEAPCPWALPPHVAAELRASPLRASHFAWRLLDEMRSDNPEPLAKRRKIVADTLRREAKEAKGHLTTDKRAAYELERFLRVHIERLREEIGFEDPPPSTEAEALLLEGGMLALDARLVRYLERLGDLGKVAAEHVRAGAKKRALPPEQVPDDGKPREPLWALWADPTSSPPGCRFARVLATVLWNDVVASWIKKTVALVLPVMSNVMEMHSRTHQRIAREEKIYLRLSDGSEARPKPETSLQPPTCELSVYRHMISRGLDLLGSLTAHKLLRWEVSEGHRQATEGRIDPRVLTVDGGWSELAETMGLNVQKRDEVHAIVLAQSRYDFPLPDGSYGDLLSLNVLPAHGRQRGRITLVLGVALLPQYVHDLRSRLGKTSQLARIAQKLVPLVDLPPLVGRPNEHGQQATFSLALVTEMRVHARELAEHGGVLLPPQRLSELAEKAGLPPATLPNVLDRWLQDGSDEPAFLEQVETNRYALSAAHSAAKAFLLEAGQREQEGAEAAHRRKKQRSKGPSRS